MLYSFFIACDISQKIKTSTKPTNHQSLITNHDLKWLKEAENIIEKELTNKQFKLSDLAGELFISQRQMSRKIKTITGLTPNRYIRSIRMHNAKVLLETGEIKTITEVALSVGLENTSHFTRLFKQEFGRRPHDYLM